jgi:hypothetical protein
MEFAIKRRSRLMTPTMQSCFDGSSALSTPHMHENGGWTICDRADCDGSAKSRAREIYGYLGACRSMHVDRFGAECFDDTRRDEGATP